MAEDTHSEHSTLGNSLRPFVPTMVLIWLLVSGFTCVSCDSVEDNDDVDQCLPKLADRCFKGVMSSLQCKLKTINTKSCVDVPELCIVLNESLDCAADIIDTDCKPDEGQTNFDYWLKGLRSIQARLCNSKDDFFRDLAATPCFNVGDFLECIEDITNVNHVVDLLQVHLDVNECNRFLIALPTCNVRASVAQSQCYMPQEIINDLILTFFSHSPCGKTCQHILSNSSNLSSYVQLILFFQAVLVMLFH